jgi:urease accessory protein
LLRLDRKLDHYQSAADSVTLGFAERQKSRFRVRLDSGREAGVFLARGGSLRDGDLLAAGDGTVVRVRAAAEPVSSVHCDDPELLARLCYHLGNRHVPLEIGPDHIGYLQDHVLDDLVRQLGLGVEVTEAVFEPEAGAYGGGHHHGHSHGH